MTHCQTVALSDAFVFVFSHRFVASEPLRNEKHSGPFDSDSRIVAIIPRRQNIPHTYRRRTRGNTRRRADPPSSHPSPIPQSTYTHTAPLPSPFTTRAMPRVTSFGASSRWVSALLLLLVAATAQLSEATYYGPYNRYGGTTVVRRTTRVRHRGGAWGRRLLQAEDVEPADDAPAPAPAADNDRRPAADDVKPVSPGSEDDEEEECQTILEIIESRPELSQLAGALEDMPKIRAAMDSKTREDTFFAPTNDAIDALLAWGGFVDKAKAGYVATSHTGFSFRLWWYNGESACQVSPGTRNRTGECRVCRHGAAHRD